MAELDATAITAALGVRDAMEAFALGRQAKSLALKFIRVR
jgi:hypothetical protein